MNGAAAALDRASSASKALLLGKIAWMDRSEDRLAGDEADAAAREAAEIGGRVPREEGIDPAERPVVEGGGGVAEGFELAEEDLVEHASHGDQQSARPAYHHRDDREEEAEEQSGEADGFRSSETDGEW